MTAFQYAIGRTVAMLALASGATAAGGQSLASRVAAAGAGEVRMTFATRAGVCGDGRNVVAVADVFTMYPSIESHGGWSRANCAPGVARVALHVGTAGIETIRTHVGGSWEALTRHVTDLGAVSATSAAAYFLDVADRSEGRVTRNALLAAVIADSADVTPRLLSIAQRVAAPAETRRQAINWLGAFGDAAIVPALAALARSGDDEKRSVGEAALVALSQVADGAGIPALIELARTAASTTFRGKAVFWLGQSGDARGRREVRMIAGDDTAASEVRAKAVFALGQGDATTADDFHFLRDLFARVDNAAIRDQILMSMSEGNAADAAQWLLSVARDEQAPVESRRKAIFWAGQGSVTSTADIARAYDEIASESVKEHAIFVLSQRDDKAATDKLLAIVHGRDSAELRKKALFWLGQRDDNAATRAISDLVTRP